MKKEFKIFGYKIKITIEKIDIVREIFHLRTKEKPILKTKFFKNESE